MTEVIPENFQLTELGALPKTWKLARFGDACLFEIGTGGTPSTEKPDYYGGEVRWMKSGDIRGLYIDDVPNRISKSGLENSNARVYPAGTIMLAMSGRGKTRGTSAVLKVPCACSQSVAAIVPKSSDIVPEFVHFNLSYRYDELRNLTGSEDRSGLNLGLIRRIKLPLPPPSEQQAIALALRIAHKAKEVRQQEVAVERERKASLMQYLFTNGTYSELRKHSEIGEIPESWQILRLGEACEFLQYGTSARCDADSSGVPVLRIPNVIDGKVDTTDLKFVKLPDKIADSLELESGDLLFVRTNGRREYTGRCAVFSGELKQALFASYLIRARLKPKTLLPPFVQLYTMTHKGQAYLSGKASNAADGKFNINTHTIKSVLIPMPSLDEQTDIVGALAACDAKILALEREAKVLDELFKAMLEELMTGRLSAMPLVDEVSV